MMKITAGTGGRWALGIVILVHVIVYNETGGATTLFSVLIATSCAIFSGKSDNYIAVIRSLHILVGFYLFSTFTNSICIGICARSKRMYHNIVICNTSFKSAAIT